MTLYPEGKQNWSIILKEQSQNLAGIFDVLGTYIAELPHPQRSYRNGFTDLTAAALHTGAGRRHTDATSAKNTDL
jgi:hypothetical protein